MTQTFPCDASKLLGALAAMPTEAGFVYTIIILRQYELGRAVPDSAEVIGRRCGGMKPKRVEAAIEWLLAERKLARTAEGLRNPQADKIIEELLAENAEAKNNGIEGAKKRWQKTAGNQRTGDSPPIERQATLSLGEEVSSSKSIKKVGAANRRTRFPEGWTPGEEGINFAIELGFGRQKVAMMFDAFRDHHVSRGNSFIDWLAAWRTWCRNELKFNSPRGGPSNGAVRARPPTPSEMIRDRMEKRDDEPKPH